MLSIQFGAVLYKTEQLRTEHSTYWTTYPVLCISDFSSTTMQSIGIGCCWAICLPSIGWRLVSPSIRALLRRSSHLITPTMLRDGRYAKTISLFYLEVLQNSVSFRWCRFTWLFPPSFRSVALCPSLKLPWKFILFRSNLEYLRNQCSPN